MSFFDADTIARIQSHLFEPQEVEHWPLCPCAQDKPWRPAQCNCDELAMRSEAAWVDSELKGERGE